MWFYFVIFATNSKYSQRKTQVHEVKVSFLSLHVYLTVNWQLPLEAKIVFLKRNENTDKEYYIILYPKLKWGTYLHTPFHAGKTDLGFLWCAAPLLIGHSGEEKTKMKGFILNKVCSMYSIQCFFFFLSHRFFYRSNFLHFSFSTVCFHDIKMYFFQPGMTINGVSHWEIACFLKDMQL